MPAENNASVTDPRADEPLPRTVVALGWVSLFTDAASDLIYPLLPTFLASLGGGALWIGWLEGVSETVSAIVKLFGGRLADRMPKKKPLIAIGYTIAALTRPLFGLATHPIQAVLVRGLDRIGKGLRGPPRDAMIAGATPEARRGHAFGFHRMMDNLGAVVGSLAAFALMRFFHLTVRDLFNVALIPGLFAVVLVLFLVKEPPMLPEEKKLAEEKATAGDVAATPLPSQARRYLIALALFSLAGSGDLFLLRRLTDLGLDATWIPIAWMSLQLGKSLLNVKGGKAADRWGRRKLLILGWALYGLSYAGFGLAPSWPIAWAVLGVYALHYGLAEGAQRALMAELVPPEVRGRAFGAQLAVEGFMVLPANVIFGLAYDSFPATAFFVAGGVALASSVALSALVRAPSSARGTS